MLVIYVIGIPALAFMILFVNRKNLSKNHVLRYFLLLYQGLKHDWYYWELCNTARKCILLSLHVLIPDDNKIIKGLLGVLTLFFFSTLQLRLQPFKIPVITQVGKFKLHLFSHLEGREMISSLLTLYGGIIFVQEDQLMVLSIFFFTLIIIANAKFWILWIYCVATVYKRRRIAEFIATYIKKVFCLSVPEVRTIIKSYNYSQMMITYDTSLRWQLKIQ